MTFNRWLGVAKGVSDTKIFIPKNISPGSVWKMRVGTENFSFTYPASIELPNVQLLDRESAVTLGLANAYSTIGGVFGGGSAPRVASLESVFYQGHYVLQAVGSSDGTPIDMDVSASDPTAARIAVTELQKGSAQRNEIQTIRFPSTPTAGHYFIGPPGVFQSRFDMPSFPLSGPHVGDPQRAFIQFDHGTSTENSAYLNLSTPTTYANDVQSFLDSFASTSGCFENVSVTLNVDNTLTVVLDVIKTFAFFLRPEYQGSGSVWFPMAPIKLFAATSTTTSMNYNATAANLETALEEIFGVGNVDVTGSYTTQFDIEFKGALAAKYVDILPCWSEDFIGTSGYKIKVTKIGGMKKHSFTIPAFNGNANVFYQFTFEDKISYMISGAARLSDVKGALENILGAGNLIIVQNSDGSFSVELIGIYIGASVSAIGMNNVTANESSVLLAETGTLEEVLTEQTIQILNRPNGGTFKLTEGGLETSSLSLDTTPTLINAALAAAGITSFICSDYDNTTITLIATSSSQHVNPLGFINSLIGCNAIDVRITQTYAEAKSAKMQIAVETDPTGGTFTLSHLTNTTSALAYNISPAALKTAIEGLASIGSGNTIVEGVNGGPYIVSFVGALAATNVQPFTGDGALLTIANSVAIDKVTLQQPTGPNWYTNKENWSLGHVPNGSEIAVFDTGSVACLYGITDIPQIAGMDVHLSYGGSIGLPDTRDTGELETLPTTLSFGSNAAKIPIRIGLGEAGSGPTIMRINTKLQLADVTVLFTQQPQSESLFTCMFDGGSYDLMHIASGSIGIAIASDTSATINKLIVRPSNQGREDVTVQWGEGATILNNEIEGGNIVGALVPKNSIVEGGNILYRGTGNLDTIYLRNARLRYQASGGVGKFGNIAAITADGSNQAVITTADPHGLTIGTRIYVRGVAGIRGLPDGYYTVTVGSSTTLTLIGTSLSLPYGASTPTTIASYYQANTAQWGLADAVRLGSGGVIDFSEIAAPRTVVAPILLQAMDAFVNDPLNTINRMRLRNDPGYLEETLGSRVIILRE